MYPRSKGLSDRTNMPPNGNPGKRARASPERKYNLRGDDLRCAESLDINDEENDGKHFKRRRRSRPSSPTSSATGSFSSSAIVIQERLGAARGALESNTSNANPSSIRRNLGQITGLSTALESTSWVRTSATHAPASPPRLSRTSDLSPPYSSVTSSLDEASVPQLSHREEDIGSSANGNGNGVSVEHMIASIHRSVNSRSQACPSTRSTVSRDSYSVETDSSVCINDYLDQRFLLRIFQFLPCLRDVDNARLVCTQWKRVASDPLLNLSHLYALSTVHSHPWRENELRLALPAGEPLQAQTSVTASMRSVLMDWLVEIAEDMAISDHALFLSSSLVDRFLSRQMVIPNKLQLLGVTALWVAAKLEEVEVPFLDDFVYTCADAYTRDDVIEMERIMLGKLNFDIAGVTVLHFLEEMFEGMPATVPAVHRAKYLAVLSLMNVNLSKELRSVVAAACFVLGTAADSTDNMEVILSHVSPCCEADFCAIVRAMEILQQIWVVQRPGRRCCASYERFKRDRDGKISLQAPVSASQLERITACIHRLSRAGNEDEFGPPCE